VASLTGSLLLLTWLQNRAERALALWGGAGIASAAGAVLIVARDQLPGFVTIGVGNALVVLGYALLWAGARRFDGRPLPRAGAVAGPIVWLAFCAVPGTGGDIAARVAAGAVIGAAYFALAAYELWRGRAEHLPSRLPLAGLLAFHTALLLMRAGLQIGTPGSTSLAAVDLPTKLTLLESGLTMIAGAYLILTMSKERNEAQARYAATHDTLTGLVNRRAFLARAEAVRAACAAEGEPLSLVVIDLDHFKAVNDCHGHPAGDRALQAFATAAVGLLGPNDLLARLGGDEFALLLPRVEPRAAGDLADRVRRAAAEALDGDPQLRGAVTLSAGAAGARPAPTLEGLVAAADRALYAAKAEGRNRVVCAPAA